MSERTLKTGDVLWYVPRDRRFAKPHSVTVGKVGRVWADIGFRSRIDKTTLVADGHGYSSPGRCYWSESEWAEGVARDRAWAQLRGAFGYGPPSSGVTAEDIRTAAKLLGLKLPDDTQGPSE